MCFFLGIFKFVDEFGYTCGCFVIALHVAGRLMIDGSKLILRVIEVGQDVFWGHVGDEAKGADVEPAMRVKELIWNLKLMKLSSYIKEH